MYSPVSQSFLYATRNSAKMVTVADIYISDSLVLENVPVTGGSVTVDSNSDIRRHGQIGMINPSASSSAGTLSGPVTSASGSFTITDLLRSEVAVKNGFIYSNGQMEVVPLGRFLVWDAVLAFESGDQLDLEIYDRAKYLQQTSILKVIDYSNVQAQTAIQDLVTRSLPVNKTVIFSSDVPDIRLPGGSTYDTDHLDAILQIAELLGAEFFFDVSGNPICQLKQYITESTTAADAVYDFTSNDDQANAFGLSKTVSREGVYNGVGVYGAQPDGDTPQPYGEAYDLNPSSITFWTGPFGKSFKRIDKPELLTSSDCYAAALAELNRSIGGSKPANFDATPNPALDAGDVVSVTFPDDSVELHILDSIDFDFDSASMSITTRSQNRTD